MNIGKIFENAPDLNVNSIMLDSRNKAKKAIFFCEPGLVNDGHDFVDQAIENGAICVVHSRTLKNYNKKVIYIKVDDTVSALNIFAGFYYGNPSHKMTVFGTTGTTGKALIAWAIRYLCNPIKPCGYLGNAQSIYGDVSLAMPHAEMNPVEIQCQLSNMHKAKMKAASLEVSSRSLDMHRFDAIKFSCAVFSNLGHEHLDYHGTIDNYYRTKMKLFRMLDETCPAVINLDDPYGKKLTADTTGRLVTYAIERAADYQAIDVRLFSNRSTFNLLYNNKTYPVVCRQLALFSVYNILAAIAAVHQTLGADLTALTAAAADIPQMEGRMQNIECGQSFTVVVDSTRSPEGYQMLLSFLRSVTPAGKRVIAGGRDTKKRPELGAIADKYCSVIVLTSEDPRLEDPEAVAAEIQAGIQENASVFVADRYDAIQQALELANKDDTVIISGKGNERFNMVNNQKQEWMGDAAAVRQILTDWHQHQGEEGDPNEN